MKPRIQAPQKGNKYYINIKDGGFNPAEGNPQRLNKDLTALANCIAIYGWFNEPGQQGQVYFTKPWYPYVVIQAAKREGLEVTQEPTLGGIMVWTGGKKGYGHVAGVGEVVSKRNVKTVESEYYGEEWVHFNRKIGDGNWRQGCYWMDKSYVYQGCIKNPFISEDEVVTDITVFNADTKKTAILKGFYKDGRNYLSLNDLSNLGVLKVSYDEEKRVPVVGKEDSKSLIKILNQDDGETYTLEGYYTDHRNYAALSDLADMGVLSVSYDPDKKMPVVGKRD